MLKRIETGTRKGYLLAASALNLAIAFRVNSLRTNLPLVPAWNRTGSVCGSMHEGPPILSGPSVQVGVERYSFTMRMSSLRSPSVMRMVYMPAGSEERSMSKRVLPVVNSDRRSLPSGA